MFNYYATYKKFDGRILNYDLTNYVIFPTLQPLQSLPRRSCKAFLTFDRKAKKKLQEGSPTMICVLLKVTK